MKWSFIYRIDLVACYVCLLFLHFFVGFKYDFHADADVGFRDNRNLPNRAE